MNKANRLIREKSPYLLQHAHNPVDWHPWGEEAFEKARREDKLILVSIGYSTCHWCHVMENECFVNPNIADVMNRYLVSIKVDREERPDVDKIYMTAVTAIAGSGGWPLNAFLTPDLKPFYGGTYFPPADRWGRMGWPNLVQKLGETWNDPKEREKILSSAESLTGHLAQYLSGQGGENPFDASIFENAFQAFNFDYDAQRGGFGGAPKFPMPVNHNFLLRYRARARKKPELSAEAEAALQMSLHSLRCMYGGGIYDHVGGGFSRYSTDERWHVPHFEKMLYDNAQIAVNYLEAFQVSGDPLFARVARETLDYVLRDLTHPDGGFYSAEDADSLPHELKTKVSPEDSGHKREGAFYLWEKNELTKLLGNEEEQIFSWCYGVEQNGNVLSDPQGEFANKNVLYLAHTTAEAAARFKKTEEQTEALLQSARGKLFQARLERPRPHLDDKIIASWNGLMISALAKAAQVLNEPRYREAAEKAAAFVYNRLYDPASGRLCRRWRDGEKNADGTADDYSFLARGLIDLYEAGFDPRWLAAALDLTEQTLARFYDSERGGFYMTEAGRKDLLFRVKEEMDNVEPCAGSVAVSNLLRLNHFLDRNGFRDAAEKTLRFFSAAMNRHPRALPQMLCSLDEALNPAVQIVIAGPREDPATRGFLEEIRSRCLPSKIVLLLDEDSRGDIEKMAPFASKWTTAGGRPTVYVCSDFSCKQPVSDRTALKEVLDNL